mgnify:CR=1 FL=1
MQNLVGMVSFYLKDGVSEHDFLLTHKKYNKEFVSMQKGISPKNLNGDRWSDLVAFETLEDIRKMFETVQECAIAADIMSSIDQIGDDNDIPIFSVVKSY